MYGHLMYYSLLSYSAFQENQPRWEEYFEQYSITLGAAKNIQTVILPSVASCFDIPLHYDIILISQHSVYITLF